MGPKPRKPPEGFIDVATDMLHDPTYADLLGGAIEKAENPPREFIEAADEGEFIEVEEEGSVPPEVFEDVPYDDEDEDEDESEEDAEGDEEDLDDDEIREALKSEKPYRGGQSLTAERSIWWTTSSRPRSRLEHVSKMAKHDDGAGKS